MPRDTSGPRETINFGLKVTRDLAKVSFSTPFESSSYSGVIYWFITVFVSMYVTTEFHSSLVKEQRPEKSG